MVPTMMRAARTSLLCLLVAATSMLPPSSLGLPGETGLA